MNSLPEELRGVISKMKTPVLEKQRKELHVIQSIYDINKDNEEEVKAEVKNFVEYSKPNDVSEFLLGCIEQAMLVRPKSTDSLINLLGSLEIKEKGSPTLIKILGGYTFYSVGKAKFCLIKEEKEIARIIRDDDVSDLVDYSSSPGVNLKKLAAIRVSCEKSQYLIPPLTYAAMYGSVKCFKYLIMNQVPLMDDISHFAIYGGNYDIIHICEQNGIAFDSCLITSIVSHRIELTLWLMKRTHKTISPRELFLYYNEPLLYFNMQESEKMETVKFLENAYKNQMYGVFEYLISNNTKELNCMELLNSLLTDGKYVYFKNLIHKGADINACGENGRTLLHEALLRHDDVAVKLLVENNADTKIKDNYGQNPLYIAIKVLEFEYANLFIRKGSDINEIPGLLFNNSLQNGKTGIVQYMVEKGYVVDKCDDNGTTPLHYAARNGRYEIVQYLCEHANANVNAVDNMWWTPLHFACINGDLRIVEYLIEKGARINALNRHSWTPLHTATIFNQKNVADYLISVGADVKISDDRGRKPLFKQLYPIA